MADSKTRKVKFTGDGLVPVAAGQTLLEASLAAGIRHYHACGGQAKCSTCRVLVCKGAENLTEPTRAELLLREFMHLPPGVRLACQTRVLGQPVRVQRIVRDEADFQLYVGDHRQQAVQQIGEERKLVLFFLDIRGFTPFIEHNSPFDVMHILRRLFLIFQTVVEVEHGGQILETAGDGFYAVFGLTGKLTDAAQAAVASGQAIQQQLARFNEAYLQRYFRHTAEAGIGIHTGRVIAGNVGLGLNSNLSVMGFAVNVAARLQAATRELNNNIVVSEQLYALLKRPQEQAPAATIRLKGVEHEVQVRLLGQPFGEKAEESTPGIAATLRKPI